MIDTAEQYQKSLYQRTQEMEACSAYGMTLKKRYEKEAQFALESAGIDLPFKPGSRILDLACGIGGHASVMRDLTGADVDARDLSAALINEGIRQEGIRLQRGDTRGRVHLAVGDMANIAPSLPEGVRYKLLTVLGDSFLYLPTPEDNQKALDQYFQLLEPGGKLVFQFRTGVNPQSEQQSREWAISRREWAQRLKVEEHFLTAQEAEKTPGKCVQGGSEIYFIKDTEKGDGFYFYNALPKRLNGAKIVMGDLLGAQIPQLYDSSGRKLLGVYGADNSLRGYLDDVGVLHSAFGRVYVDADGNEEDLGIAEITGWRYLDAFPALEKMLLRAGFANVKLQQKPLTSNGDQIMFTVTAEKSS